jgi:response regulator NasT
MNRPLRIAVADDEAFMRDYYREILPLLGHEAVAAAQTGRELVEHCRTLRPDVVLTDIRMPDMDGIDAAVAINREAPAPVILVSAYHDSELFERAREDPILAYLIKPIKQPQLEAAVAMALRRFEQFRALRREAADLPQALEDRKVIECAKGVLMRQAHVDEQEAFHRLQKVARDNNKKLVELARMILLADQAFHLPKEHERPA